VTTVELSATVDDLRARAADALVSLWNPANASLRQTLRERLAAWPGQGEALLAPPVLEARFGYQTDARTMAELAAAGELPPELVKAMDEVPPGSEEQRFPRDRHPYVHQVEAWDKLRERRSVVVATGTGSGKTECFLVPALEDALRALPGDGGPVVGVQTLLLYPLNALIESQRERLGAWTHGFQGRIRYCLYNGNTPDEVQAHRRAERPQEVMDRKGLRAAPPPLLVTNATMLEYMLVRPEDAPILEKSQGKLRTIVLDEAHTYVGSRAAELALLLRRALLAFGVRPQDVRFVATSATIGDPAMKEQLQRFLGAVAGQDWGDVVVVTGEAEVPPLAPEGPDLPLDPEALGRLEGPALHAALSRVPAARELRREVAAGARALDGLSGKLLGGADVASQRRLLRLVDAVVRARDDRGAPFLPLRAHLFARTPPGIWVCGDPGCAHKRGLDAAWPFGAVYLSPRERCDCGFPAYPMAGCERCGGEYLEGLLDHDNLFAPPLLHLLALLDEDARPEDADAAEDAPAAEAVEGEEDGGDTPVRDAGPGELHWLRPVPNGEGGARAPRRAPHGMGGEELPWPGGHALVPAPGSLGHDDAEHGAVCVLCRHAARRTRAPIRTVRAGSPFMLSTLIPALLPHLPKENPEQPAGGRRLISFTDSRQGSARFALSQQLDAERMWLRGQIWRRAWAAQPAGLSDSEREQRLEERNGLLAEIPAAGPFAAAMLRQRLQEVEARLAGDAGPPRFVPLPELAQALQDQEGLRFIRDDLISRGRLNQDQAAWFPRMMLFQELARRPLKSRSVEAMGLVDLVYPPLGTIAVAPSHWQRLVRQSPAPDGVEPLEEWRRFLKLVIDHHVRQAFGLTYPPEWEVWLGIPFPPRVLRAPVRGAPEGNVRRTVPWPMARGGARVHQVPRLLLAAFGLNAEDGYQRELVNDVMEAAWHALLGCGLLEMVDANVGAKLNLFGEVPQPDQTTLPRAAVAPVTRLWRCPVTRAGLSGVLRERSPYEDPRAPLAAAARAPGGWVPLPRPPGDHLQTPEQMQAWTREAPELAELRALGLWTDLHDRVVCGPQPHFVREHSAQISARNLGRAVERFKAGNVNVLSCSTTMEMGVDIGALTAVTMNNVPPAPANYRQRAGRAGRRSEALALSVTLARALPHDQAVFKDPTWPFTGPMSVPKVALDRPRIVERHVAARVLNAFLRDHFHSHTLTCRHFLRPLDGPAVWDRFQEWIEQDAPQDQRLVADLAHLVRGTALASAQPAALFVKVRQSMVEAVKPVRDELRALDAEEEEARAEAEAAGRRESLRTRALKHRRVRVEDEYLLSWLAEAQVLPGHGMPTGVVPFVNVTRVDLAREKEDRGRKAGERERARGRARDYPSYPGPLALRAYAPGNVVVIDAQTHTAAGVTLNWHQAPDSGAPEEQDLQHLTHCARCGRVEVGPYRPGGACPEPGCGGRVEVHPVLLPEGYAVDVHEAPVREVRSTAWQPVLPARVSGHGREWGGVGAFVRVRHDPEGLLVHEAAGPHGHGYAICLQCGRAAPEEHAQPERGRPDRLPPGMSGHKRLRGGREAVNGGNDAGVACSGNGFERRRYRLVSRQRTDVVELDLTHPGTLARLTDMSVGMTLAVALRDALAEHLGVEAAELGYAARPLEAGVRIAIYDTAVGGAGFASELPDRLPQLLRRVRDRLSTCSCQRACERCLVGAETQHALRHLNRLAALEFLTDELLQSLSPPEGWGSGTAWEWRVPAVALQARAADGARLVRLWCHGEQTDWDLPRWRELELVRKRILGLGVPVELAFPPGQIDRLDLEDKRLLRGLRDSLGWAIVEGEAPTPCWAEVDAPGGAEALWTDAPTGFFEGWMAPADGGVVRLGAQRVDRLRPIDLVADHRLDEVDPAQFVGVRFAPAALRGGLPAVVRGMFDVIVAQAPARVPQGGGPAAQVEVRDRYLRSPQNIGHLSAFLREMERRRWVSIDATALLVVSAVPHARESPWPPPLHADWSTGAEQERCLRVALGRYRSVDVKIERDTSAVEHHRELVLRWDDGQALVLRPDQGMGVVQTDGTVRRQEPGDPETVGQQAARADWQVRSAVKTDAIVYVGSAG
jgi:DEAD/DEAH box helicase domain-containing protein